MRTPPARAFIAVAVAMSLPLAFIALLDRAAAIAPDAPHRLGSALHLADARSTPPPLAADWQPLVLRHFRRDQPSVASWYRFDVERPAGSGGAAALMLPEAFSHTRLFVNGDFLGEGGPRLGIVPVHRAPLLLRIPFALLDDGRNTLMLHVESPRGAEALDAAWFGPETALQPAFERLHFVKVVLKQATLAIVPTMMLTMALLALWLHRDAFYGWASASLGAWTLSIAHHMFDRSPLASDALWDSLGGVFLGWFVFAGVIVAMELQRLPAPWMRRLLAGWAIAGGAVLIATASIAPAVSAAFNQWLWLPSAIAAGAGMLWLLARGVLRGDGIDCELLFAVTLLVLIVGVRDYVVYFQFFAAGSPTYLSYTGVVVALAFTVLLLRRFVRAFREVAELNRDLEARVASKAAELGLNMQRVAGLERERAVFRERERLTREMHDGIGGLLVQGLMTSSARRDPADVQAQWQACLDELRLMIDTMEPSRLELLSALGMLRVRTARRLATAGIETVWDVEDISTRCLPDAHATLHVLRVVQEAFTNALKHARATTLTLRVRDRGDGVLIEVRDDGDGFAPTTDAASVDAATGGHGLTNMRHRAAELGGRIEFDSSSRGTTVRLWVPAQAPASSPASNVHSPVASPDANGAIP